jgi:hypothetical protein
MSSSEILHYQHTSRSFCRICILVSLLFLNWVTGVDPVDSFVQKLNCDLVVKIKREHDCAFVNVIKYEFCALLFMLSSWS